MGATSPEGVQNAKTGRQVGFDAIENKEAAKIAKSVFNVRRQKDVIGVDGREGTEVVAKLLSAAR